MTLNLLLRKTHYWTAFVIALPILVIISTGVLLQLKKQWRWVQPAELRGTGMAPAIDFDGIMASLRTLPEMNVSGWEDVRRLDVRPGRGMVKAWLENGWEVQIDLSDGKVLQAAYRRSDLIESIHDGSFFGGDWIKLGLFLPAGVALFVLWCTGLWMWWLPISVRRRRARLGVNRPLQAPSRSR